MLKEIGSNFWITPEEKNSIDIDRSIFNTYYEDEVFTSSGRSAISLILSDIENNVKKALLPSFTCESVIDPFIRQDYQVCYYHITANGTISQKLFLEDLQNNQPSVVFIHNYFGFNTTSEITELIPEIRKRGIIVIEDITQTLYSEFLRSSADYYIGSFRKWAGIPDGGFALKATGRFRNKPKTEDSQLAELKLNAMRAKYDYLFHGTGDKNSFLRMFAEAEDFLERQDKIYQMSSVSRREQASLKISDLKKRRIDNFRFLLNNIPGSNVLPLFDELPEKVVPLYFPVLCKQERHIIQTKLRDNQIFAPIVWPKPDFMTEHYCGSDHLYENLLCIPCDQRYGIEEMERISSIIGDKGLSH